MIDWGTWLLCLPPALLLTVAAWFSRRQMGTWSAPGPMALLTWCCLTWFALLLAPDFAIWPGAIWALLGLMVAIHLGGMAGEALLAGRPHAPYRPIDLLRIGRTTSIVGSCAGVFAVVHQLHSLGESLTSLLSPTELILLAGRMSIRRYEQFYVEPLISRVLMAGPYAAALVSGVCAGSIREGKLPRWLWYPFIPALLLATVTTARAILLFIGVLFVGGWIASSIYAGRNFKVLVTWRSFRIASLATIGFVVVAGLLQQARYGEGSPWTVFTLLGHMRTWFFGYVAALGIWLREGAAAEAGTSFGSFTFAGVFSLLGISARSLGIFRDFAYIGQGEVTNVYTMWRGVIQDFGIAGGAFVSFLFGALAGAAHAMTRRGQLAGIPILAIFYAEILFGFITSLFNYNSIILAWLIFVALLAWSRVYPRFAGPASP